LKNWSEFLNASNGQILDWAEAQPWSGPMRDCAQDSEWHAEGDVWTHTRMVFEEVTRLPEFNGLPRPKQVLLLLVALFHDMGKPATTRPDPLTGRMRSPKHSLVGAAMARDVLRNLGCEIHAREDIARMVRYHGRPPFLLETGTPEAQLIRLSWQLSNRLLYLFCLADTRGRITRDFSRSENTLHLWRDTAMELGCLQTPYPFVNDQARFLFHRDELSSLHYTPHENFPCSVTMLSGLPGAGKDTWLARHAPQLPVVSLDAVRDELDVDASDNHGAVIQAAREQCREHLRAHRDFAFNATNLTLHLRKRWIDLFTSYGARVEIVYLEPPLETILRQNKERERTVPESVIRRLFAKVQIPTLAEAHAVRWVE
jgi:putative nucleotidyltransferase with HDIG domain